MRHLSAVSVAVAYLLGNCGLIAESPLARFVNKDIGNLSKHDKAELKSLLASHQPISNRSHINHVPLYLWRYQTVKGSERFILFEQKPVIFSHSATYVYIHILAMDGKVLGTSEVAIGFQHGLHSVTYREDRTLGIPIIEVHTKPCCYRDAVMHHQYYAIMNERVALLRVADERGKLVSNVYHNSDERFGPTVQSRSAKDWENSLSAEHPAEILEALTWIGGAHLTVSQKEKNMCCEEEDSVRLVSAVRERPGVQKTIKQLMSSEQPWIKEAAQLTMSEIDDKKNK